MSRLSEQAFEALEHRLVTLHWSPGQVLTEQQLVDATGIGRTPVREAIQKLAGHGLLQVMPRKGLVVSAISRGKMLRLLEVRRVLERLVLEQAAVRADAVQRGALDALADRAESASEDPQDWFVLDRQLDQLLARACGNEYAVRALEPLMSHSRRFWWYGKEQLDGSGTRRAHAEMARAVARGDGTGAGVVSDGIIGSLERLARQIDTLD